MPGLSKLRLLLAAVAFALAFYIATSGRFNEPAPAFSLPRVYGGQVSLESYRGRPVLLVFWTTSCPICQHELPVLSRLEPEMRDKGVSVLAILLGGEDDASEFMGANNINLTTAYDSDGTVGRAYRVGGVPKLVLVGNDGKVKCSRSGWTDEDTLRHWIDSVSGG